MEEDELYNDIAAINGRSQKNAAFIASQNSQVNDKIRAWEASSLYVDQPLSTDTKARNIFNQRYNRFSKEYDNRPIIQQDEAIQGADSKKARAIATTPPKGTDPTIAKELNQSKGIRFAGSRMLNEEVLERNPDIVESGYPRTQTTVQGEHALSVGIDRRNQPKIKTGLGGTKEEIEAGRAGFNPLETIGKDKDGNWRAAYNRGGDSGKTVFPGSGAYNIRIQTDDSFSIREIKNIGRPTNWQETVWDQIANGNDVQIDITEQDWHRLQQGKITDGELIAHKFNVEEQGKRGNIFIDAEDPADTIADIHRKDRQQISPKKHFEREVLGSPGGLKSRTFNSKLRNDLNNFRVNKLAPAVKGARKIRRADIVAQLGVNASTGNIAGAFVNASFLSASLVGANPRTQKMVADIAVRIASQSAPVRKDIQRQLLRAVGKRGVRSAGKLIPGVDVYLSAQEAWGYARQGKWDQAAIASLSGAVGWFPGLGDFAAAMLDATNTVIDVSRMSFGEDYEVEDGPDPKKKRQQHDIQEVNYKGAKRGVKIRWQP